MLSNRTRKNATHLAPLVHKNELDRVVFALGYLGDFRRDPSLLLVREPDSDPLCIDIFGHNGQEGGREEEGGRGGKEWKMGSGLYSVEEEGRLIEMRRVAVLVPRSRCLQL